MVECLVRARVVRRKSTAPKSRAGAISPGADFAHGSRPRRSLGIRSTAAPARSYRGMGAWPTLRRAARHRRAAVYIEFDPYVDVPGRDYVFLRDHQARHHFAGEKAARHAPDEAPWRVSLWLHDHRLAERIRRVVLGPLVFRADPRHGPQDDARVLDEFRHGRWAVIDRTRRSLDQGESRGRRGERDRPGSCWSWGTPTPMATRGSISGFRSIGPRR
jgi:hypothetical protein